MAQPPSKQAHQPMGDQELPRDAFASGQDPRRQLQQHYQEGLPPQQSTFPMHAFPGPGPNDDGELGQGMNPHQRSNSPFQPPFMHPALAQMMQQQQQQHHHMMQQQMFHGQQSPYFGAGPHPFSSDADRASSPSNNQATSLLSQDGQRMVDDQTLRSGAPKADSVSLTDQGNAIHRNANNSPQPTGPPHQTGSMFNRGSGLGPPGFEKEFGGQMPPMVPVQTPNGLIFMPMNSMTPPPGFGHFPRPDQEPQFHFHQQQQHLQHQQHLQMQHQMFLHQQMMQRQHQQQQQQQQQRAGQSFESSLHQSERNVGEQSPSGPRKPEEYQQHGLQEQQGSKERPRSQEVQAIENQINKLLNSGGPSMGAAPSPLVPGGQVLTVQEIEQAQTGELIGQFRRFSLDNPVTPPSARASTGGSKANRDSLTPSSSTSQQRSSFFDRRFQDPSAQGEQPRYQPSTTKSRFSVKDIDFYSDKKYDPYRPSFHTFEQISRDAERLCQELHPKAEEETRKIALLQKLSDIATEVFGEAEVLPFGSSGNGLALANADMDVCVFLNSEEGADEVSPVEFVERIGNRLEQDPDFENILQLKRARVPIVKLNHINGIACDIGYQNDLAIWNTRLLRAYCKIDSRVRDIVVIVKHWAKRRKINNPYTGSLSSYAYVLLVIHVLQRRGVLPNLQSIVPGDGDIPIWDCQGFNRYFFEDVANLGRYWQPTPEGLQQSVGELLYEFFRYYASDFKYTTHAVSIRSGGLLTKEEKEWTKDHTQPQNQQQRQDQQQEKQQTQPKDKSQPSEDSQPLDPLQQPEAEASPTEGEPDAPVSPKEGEASDQQTASSAPPENRPPVVKNRYLFCIEDPFELNHNVGRPVDRFSLFTIRGEFMRAAKILSRNGDGALGRLCVEREIETPQERIRNGSVDHGDERHQNKASNSESGGNVGGPRRPSLKNYSASDAAVQDQREGTSPSVSFAEGESTTYSSSERRPSVQGGYGYNRSIGSRGSIGGGGIAGQSPNSSYSASTRGRDSLGPTADRKQGYKRATIAGEPRRVARP
ncbi:terminal uridylyltransferase [Entomortierella parvispora]|uniref:polynucleotide adenylyltransferase n=1 Tax=Entomortierella parvispora TaxID=205924 RepID=A0A9P3H3T6_9FUNG|nr:terminal uridylyltransferase [Entomortierella parvispora]